MTSEQDTQKTDAEELAQRFLLDALEIATQCMNGANKSRHAGLLARILEGGELELRVRLSQGGLPTITCLIACVDGTDLLVASTAGPV
jgi:hypothetical protein